MDARFNTGGQEIPTTRAIQEAARAATLPPRTPSALPPRHRSTPEALPAVTVSRGPIDAGAV